MLATSVIDELKDEAERCSEDSYDLLYYFFKLYQANFTSVDSSAAAYRSKLAQLLSHHRFNRDIIDKFSFSMINEWKGQL